MSKKNPKTEKLVEIARSFSYKLSVPGKYESRDFFCSQKIEVPENQAIEASEKLFEFCKDEVMKSVHNYLMENMPQPEISPQVAKQLKDWQMEGEEKEIQIKEDDLEKANQEIEAQTEFKETEGL